MLKKLQPIYRELKYIYQIVTKISETWDPGIRKKPIPDSDSEVKKAPDPQHFKRWQIV